MYEISQDNKYMLKNMSEQQNISPMKSAIIGKIWINKKEEQIVPASYTLPRDMSFTANQSYLIGNLSFRTDRNLAEQIEVKAGEKLFFYSNSKRTEKDPDYSVSVILPQAQAEMIITNAQNKAKEWRESHK